ncbi:MAG: four helix bundle suffix domain-containing protein [Verrucomicrobiota bacterium]
MNPPEPEPFLPKKGNYRELLSYKKAEIIYDLTFQFTERHLRRGDRTVDQMVQAARSGKQNIAEGAKAGVTSSEMEIKLTNVARASLEELLLDFEDYLRSRRHSIWEKGSKEALYVRKLGSQKAESFADYKTFLESRPPEVIANIALCLIHQANYLLDQQIRRLEKDFVSTGGLKEQMYNARARHRSPRS